MFIYNYLFYQCTKLNSNDPRHWAFVLVGIVQSLVLFILLKVMLIEIYNYDRYKEIFKQGEFIVYYTIAMFILSIIDIIYFKESKIDEYEKRWGADNILLASLKVIGILLINLMVFLYFDDMMNMVRHYW